MLGLFCLLPPPASSGQAGECCAPQRFLQGSSWSPGQPSASTLLWVALSRTKERTQHSLTLLGSSVSHPGPSARSTGQRKQCGHARTAKRPASFAWSMWRSSCPTRLWCAPAAGRPGSIGAASRYEALPVPLGQGRCLAAVPRSRCLSLLQQQAFHAGLLCFRCPQCNHREKFLPELSFLGIQVPSRLVLFCPSAVPPRQMNCAGPAHRLSAQALSPTAVAADRRTGDPRQGRSRPPNLPGSSSHTSTQLLASMLLWGKGRPCFPPSILPSPARPLTTEVKMV